MEEALATQTKGEIVVYQPDNSLKMEVILLNETVWLSQAQIAELFGTKRPAITKHLSNIFYTGELEEDSVCSILEHTAGDGKIYKTKFYNLDAILSIGYRVNSVYATLFRKWASSILKDYMFRGIAINQRIDYLEQHAVSTDKRLAKTEEQIEYFVRTALPPKEGVFCNGQVFDAYIAVSDLVKSAKQSVILIDNYVDESVLAILAKRPQGVTAKIYTDHLTATFNVDLQRHNAQYPAIDVVITHKAHDRFLIIDDTVYLFGASIKDLGKKLFAYIEMNTPKSNILNNL